MTETLTPGALAKRDLFGSEGLERSADVQSAALAAQAEAEVKARWAIAKHSPRNFDNVRVALLRDCDRPSFADVAKYSKPQGKEKIVGPSIRFVEAALRSMGNIICSTSVVSEDRETRRLQVMVTDLETNVSWPRQITIQKTVERKDSRGRQVIGERTNSYGEPVYIVLATEDELGNKEGALVSKVMRTAGLRIIPGDLVEECMARVDKTRQDRARKDPDGERKRIVDAFVGLGVKPDQLAEYLGHGLDLIPPSEISELRDLYAAMKDGETKWADALSTKKELEGPAKSAAPSPAPAPVPLAPPASPPPPSPSPGAAAPRSSPPPAGGVTAEAILEAIGRCTTGKQLAGEPLKLLGKASQEVRAQVREAYEARAKELRGQS